MLSVSAALDEILNVTAPLPVEILPLALAGGRTLARQVLAAADSPPFDKALMDGYAVRAHDLAPGAARLAVIEEITAGHVPQRPLAAGQTTRIMTGAPLPAGADAVVPVEQSQADDAGWVRLTIQHLAPGRNILRRAESQRAGVELLPAGTCLRAAQLACLAEQGEAEVAVVRQARVAVLATGDELVPYTATPGPGQIRNSNELMLVQQVQQNEAAAIPLGVARDEISELSRKIEEGLQADVLLLSGGVSAGKLDLVPGILRHLEVREVFHKVRIKPGQPVWFGTAPRDQQRTCHVFGLPGNPVSSLVCFEVFVRPALRRLMGFEPAISPPVRAQLHFEYLNRGNRPTYHPARLEQRVDSFKVTLVPWVGSADLSGCGKANAMAVFPEGETCYRSGEWIDVWPW